MAILTQLLESGGGSKTPTTNKVGSAIGGINQTQKPSTGGSVANAIQLAAQKAAQAAQAAAQAAAQKAAQQKQLQQQTYKPTTPTPAPTQTYKPTSPTVTPTPQAPAKTPEPAKVWTAAELAKLYGIDYDLASILADYNNSTNQYYNSAISQQEELRNKYARDNAGYSNSLINDYLKTYQHTAPTAVGQGSLAANALSAQINADYVNASNDYGMLQSLNNYNQAHQTELAGNEALANQYYNNIGTYLSTLSAEKNKSDVAQYVADMDKYASNYESDRNLSRSQAEAAAATYTGLANAQATKAASTNTSNPNAAYDGLYNYFKAYYGNDEDASKWVSNLLKTNKGA